MAFLVWAIACVLVSKAYGVRQHGTNTEEALHWKGHQAQWRLTPKQELLDGARAGNLSKVEEALAKGAEVNSVDGDGQTPLFLAAQAGHLEVVEKLLAAKGVDTEIQSRYSGTPLERAAFKGHFKVVKMLLDHDALVDSENYLGETPLFSAAKEGHTEIVKLLLDKKADAKHQDRDEDNALHKATFGGVAEIIKMLLEKHVPVNHANNRRVSPLHNAAIKNLESVKLLLDAGADVNPLNSLGETPLDVCKKYFKYFGKGDQKAVEEILIKAGGIEKGGWDSRWDFATHQVTQALGW